MSLAAGECLRLAESWLLKGPGIRNDVEKYLNRGNGKRATALARGLGRPEVNDLVVTFHR